MHVFRFSLNVRVPKGEFCSYISSTLFRYARAYWLTGCSAPLSKFIKYSYIRKFMKYSTTLNDGTLDERETK